MADGDRRRAEIGQRRPRDLDQRIDQPVAVGHDLPPIVLVDVEHDIQITGNGRAAMRVRRIEQKLPALRPYFSLTRQPPCRTFRPRQADQIDGNDHDAFAPGVFQRQGLGPEIVQNALRGAVRAA